MNPRLPVVYHGAVRLAFLLVASFLMLNLGGCAFFRKPAPLTLPAGFMTRADLAGLRNPQTRQAAYKALFPQLQTVWAGGTLSAHSRWRRGKQIVDFVFYSRNDVGSFDHMLRLNGTRGQFPLFDIIVRGRYATVIVYPDKLVFQGQIPPEGSPLAERFGVEPWDLVPVFNIGQVIAAGDFKEDIDPRTTELEPRDSKNSGGLCEVELENLSGLPRSAKWKLGGKTYDVTYEGWDFYADPRENIELRQTRLMPSALKIRRGSLVIELKMRAYHYDQQPADKTFSPLIDQNFRMLPLEKLKKVL